MARKKNYKWCQDEVSTFGKSTPRVTKVKGHLVDRESIVNNLCTARGKFEDALYEALGWWNYGNGQYEGVAKCLPEDTFDEKTGISIANKKAKLHAVKAKLVSIDKALHEFKKIESILLQYEDQLDADIVKLELQLLASKQ